MIFYPNAKINLGLRIAGRRPDGYHDLETVFYPVGWCDILEIVPAPGRSYRVRFTVSGLPLPGRRRDNLVVRAVELLRQRYALPPLRIHLHKQIPAGAGLGGGSADAAITLQGVVALLQLPAGDDDLHRMALTLGSDVPFFLLNRPALATGRGEELTPLPLSLEGYHLLIVFPAIPLNTGRMFRETRPQKHPLPPRRAVALPPEQWKGKLVNDFEPTATTLAPAIGTIVDTLYRAGAVYASLSGSGSAVYGIFREAPPPLSWPEGYLIWSEEL